MLYVSITVGSVSKYRAFSGAYFPTFGPEKTPYLDTFHTVYTTFLHENIKITQDELAQGYDIIESQMEIQSIVFDSLLASRNSQTISDLH